MVAAVTQSISFGMVFAENLEITLSLRNYTFDNIIDFDRHRLLSIRCPIIFALTTGTLEFTLLCNSSLCILWVLDHFSGDTLSASSVFAAYHKNWLACC